MFANDLKCQNQSQPKLWRPVVAFKELLKTYDSYLKKHMDEATKLSYVETFCSSAPGLSNIPNLTAIIQMATGVSLSTAQQMDIVESQALMDDNTALLPQRGRTREHRSVILTNFNPFPFPTEEYNEYPHDDGEGYITVFYSHAAYRGGLFSE